MIEVDHLSKHYGSLVAVDDLSFDVAQGEIVGFLGPNGAGKTTTMRVLTGYLPATGGSARVAGFDIFECPMEVKRRIGYLPEHPPVYRDMYVHSYLSFVAKIKGVPKKARGGRIDEVMARCGIEDRANQLIGQLSKGYQQRVGLAQAIVHNPDVIILDEPTIGLDPNQIRDVRSLVRGLAKEHTVILSTLILPEVEMTGDLVVIRECDGVALPWLLRPSTGELYRFDGWASDQFVDAVLVRSIEGATSLRVVGGAICDHIQVEVSDGSDVVISG